MVDIDALPDIGLALEKLELLLYAVDERRMLDEERFFDESLWGELIELHFGQYCMQYFLSTSVTDDGEWKYRASAFSNGIKEKGPDLIAFRDSGFDGQEFSLQKIEDLAHQLNSRL